MCGWVCWISKELGETRIKWARTLDRLQTKSDQWAQMWEAAQVLPVIPYDIFTCELARLQALAARALPVVVGESQA
jgi:hypothetical protein